MQKITHWLLAFIHDALYRDVRVLEGREESPTLAIIDAQSTKTGPDARGDVGFDAGKNVKGRKRHIVVDILGMILKVEVHSAGIQDRDGAALSKKSSLTALMPAPSHRATAQGPLKSSNVPIRPRASSSCPNDGSSNEPSHGSASIADSQRILSVSRKPLWPSFTPP